jgi:tetratricopeptide (TPR) repeat protein
MINHIGALALCLSLSAADFDQLAKNGHWKRARDLAEADLRANPNDARANYEIALVRKVFGALDQAQEFGETSVRLDPNNGEYHRNLADIYGDIANKAGVFKAMGMARKCRAELETAASLDPKDVENLEAFMIFSIEAPSIIGGDKKKAAELAAQIVKIDPARGYLAQARIARQEKRDNELRGLYEKAVESNPRNYDAQVLLANHYLSVKEYAAAEQHARAAIDLAPENALAYKLLASSLVRLKRVLDAEAIAIRAEKAIPDDLAPYQWAARSMLAEGVDLEKAESFLRKYLSQPPEPVEPSLAQTHVYIAQVYEKLSRKSDARSELEAALRLQPDFEPAKHELKRLN